MREIKLDSRWEKPAYVIEITEDKYEKVFDAIIKYMLDNSCFSGETLHQDDECIIEAPSCLSDIIDNIIQPKYIGEDLDD